MNTVVIATRKPATMKILGERYSATMLPLMDRPFIQHVIEYLVKQNITQFDLILSHLPENVESLFENGERWGAQFHYHLARDPEACYTALKRINLQNEETLLVHADRLIQSDIVSSKPTPLTAPLLYCHQAESEPENELDKTWSGWAWIPPRCLAGLSEDADEKSLLSFLKVSHADYAPIDKPLSVQTAADLLDSSRSVLAGKGSQLLVSGKEAEPGIWLSRNVSLHPESTLTAPLYIGENCRIEKKVRLGPNTVVGADCLVEQKTIIADTIICPGSFIGEGLELKNALVDKNCLVNTQQGLELPITEDFILGSLKSNSKGLSRLQKFVEQVTAVLLLLLTLPFTITTAAYLKLFRKGQVLQCTKALRLPTLVDPSTWKYFPLYHFNDINPPDTNIAGITADLPATRQIGHGWLSFFLFVLPGFFSIAKGDLSFVGVAPRTKAEVLSLPEDWCSLYIKSKPGIITEAMVNFGSKPSLDELYAAESFYAVKSGWIYDLKILGKYLCQLVGLYPLP
ncbi:sugar transferase [Desulfobacterales bacterium HSG17]|nr:sugar transferase [Desulfobacterales bacterium HSG17]